MGIPMQDHRQDGFVGSEVGRREERLREAATRRAEVFVGPRSGGEREDLAEEDKRGA